MKIFLFFILLLTGCGGNTSSDSMEIRSLTDLTIKYHVPALAAGIMQDGVLKEIDVRGVRKIGSDSLAEENDAFHLGSCTKSMTSTLAGIFIEEGKLNWTTTLGELFPEFNLHPEYKTMTFETLLVHRGGFPVEDDSLFNLVSIMDPVQGRTLISKTLLERTPMTVPGASYRYSNFNYIIAGHILERINQKSWEELIREKIFVPLSMFSCGFGRTSKANELSPSSIWAHYNLTPRHFDNPLTYGPSSTVHCSMRDWSKFLDIHLKGFNGESNLLRSETYKKLHSVHPSNDSTYTYGGWSLLNRNWAGGPVLTHNGSNLMNYAVAWIAPKKNAFIMSATNVGGDDAFSATDSAIALLISKYLNQ